MPVISNASTDAPYHRPLFYNDINSHR